MQLNKAQKMKNFRRKYYELHDFLRLCLQFYMCRGDFWSTDPVSPSSGIAHILNLRDEETFYNERRGILESDDHALNALRQESVVMATTLDRSSAITSHV